MEIKERIPFRVYVSPEDWGPVVKKLILDCSEMEEDQKKYLLSEKISVYVKKENKLRDRDGTEKGENIEEGYRTVTAVYAANVEGEVCEDGDIIIIEMQVHPDHAIGNYFFYNVLVEQNQFTEFSYDISVNEEKLPLKYVGDYCPSLKDFDLFGIYEDGDILLHYASFIPEHKEKKVPLLIWLHGAGEGGEQPAVALLGNRVVGLKEAEIQNCFGPDGAAILVPQCFTMWMDYTGHADYNTDAAAVPSNASNTPNTAMLSDSKSYYAETLSKFLHTYVEQHPEIDEDRIYIGGCSNGGYMTVKMVVDNPDFFAAAFPVCSAYDDIWLNAERAEILKKNRIWFTAAKTDDTVRIIREDGSHRFSLKIYDEIGADSLEMHYSLLDRVVDPSGEVKAGNGVDTYEYFGHWSWIPVLRNKVTLGIGEAGKQMTTFEWLASKKR